MWKWFCPPGVGWNCANAQVQAFSVVGQIADRRHSRGGVTVEPQARDDAQPVPRVDDVGLEPVILVPRPPGPHELGGRAGIDQVTGPAPRRRRGQVRGQVAGHRQESRPLAVELAIAVGGAEGPVEPSVLLRHSGCGGVEQTLEQPRGLRPSLAAIVRPGDPDAAALRPDAQVEDRSPMQEESSREKGKPVDFLPRRSLVRACVHAQRVGPQPLAGNPRGIGTANETGAGAQQTPVRKPHEGRRVGDHIRLGDRVDDREFVGEGAAPAAVTGARHHVRHGPNLAGTLAQDKLPG